MKQFSKHNMVFFAVLFICQTSHAMKQQQHFDQASAKYKEANKKMLQNQNLTARVKPEDYTKEDIHQVEAKNYYDNDLAMDAAKQKQFQGNNEAVVVKKSNDTNRHEINPNNPAYKTALGHQNNAEKILGDKGDRYGCTEIQGKGSQKAHTETCQASNVQPMQCIRYPEVKITPAQDINFNGQASVDYRHGFYYAGAYFIFPHTGILKSFKITANSSHSTLSIKLPLFGTSNAHIRWHSHYQIKISPIVNHIDAHVSTDALTYHYSDLNIPVTAGQKGNFHAQQVFGWVPDFTITYSGLIQIPATQDSITIKDTRQNINKQACTKVKEQCVEGAATRNIGGVNVHQPCWKYDLAYTCGYKKYDTCDDIAKRCNFVSQRCIEEAHGYCFAYERTYKCTENQEGKKELICGNPNTIQFQQAIEQGDPNEFLKAVSALAGVSEAGDSVKKQQKEINMLKGESQDCGEGALGVYDCCDSGGNFLHGCSESEKALQKARQKKIASFAGRYCGKKVLGVCVAHRQTWCVFDSKLARILQEQGRVKQLGISFGSGEHPNCTGMTPDQLQKLHFRKIDFSEFFEDVKTKATLPDAGLSNSLSNKYQRDKTKPEMNTKMNQSSKQK